jgi:hypothetical protein
MLFHRRSTRQLRTLPTDAFKIWIVWRRSMATVAADEPTCPLMNVAIIHSRILISCRESRLMIIHSCLAKSEGMKRPVSGRDAPAETRTPNLYRANESLLESANGSMATVATRQEKTDVSQFKNRIDLIPTGLLMEGVCTNLRHLFVRFCCPQAALAGSMSEIAMLRHLRLN